MFESLEMRRHFSVSAYIQSGTLVVLGDNNPNGISVDQTALKYRVKQYVDGVGYQTVAQFNRGRVQRIHMHGLGGNDTLGVADNVNRPATLVGGAGADYLEGGGGASQLLGHGSSTNPLDGNNPGADDGAADQFVTGKGASFMLGQKGNDQFFLNQPEQLGVVDEAQGGPGNDIFYLSAGRGSDVIGGDGNDSFMIGPVNAFAQMIGGDGSDTVDYLNFPFGVYATNDGEQMSGPLQSFENERKHIIDPDVETIMGTDLRDSLQNHNAVGNLFGRGAYDNLYGKGGRNVLDGGAGDDIIVGGGNHDTIFGGDGDDKINGDSGNDIIKGDAGKDSLYGDSGNDRVYGGSQNDLLEGGSGNDSLYGEGGGDHLHGDGGANLLVGGSGADYLYAKNGITFDVIIGDNADGSGATNAYDIAVIDIVQQQGMPLMDLFSGVEHWTV